MTTIEERAPLGLLLTPTEREALAPLLAEVEAKAQALTETLGQVRAILAEPVTVDLGDPLAMFRLPSGAVAYTTTYVDHVEVGEWVQRCAGDLDWHQVTEVETLDEGWIRLVYDGLAHDWLGTDALRVARPADVVVAGQDR